MGTTSTSGWAVFFFTVGFTALGTFALGSTIGGLIGIALIILSGYLFKSARVKEEA